jgi:hypothetical protein
LFAFAKGGKGQEEELLLNVIQRAQEELKGISNDVNEWFQEGKLYLDSETMLLTFHFSIRSPWCQPN